MQSKDSQAPLKTLLNVSKLIKNYLLGGDSLEFTNVKNIYEIVQPLINNFFNYIVKHLNHNHHLYQDWI